MRISDWSSDVCSSDLLTPYTTVRSTPFAGAEISPRLAPAARCFDALSRSAKNPVHSSAMSTPSSGRGRLAGSRSAVTRMRLPSTTIESPTALTSPGTGPWRLSRLHHQPFRVDRKDVGGGQGGYGRGDLR